MEPGKFIERINSASFSPFMGVPCSVFTPLLNYLEGSDFESYICTSEGEAMGLAGGFALSGKLPVVYMQNDGYGNAVNPISSLQLMYKLPALLLISWRGFPGTKDAPQHMLMGETIESFLDTFKIPYTVLDGDEDQLKDAVNVAKNHCTEEKTPYAFIIKKGYFPKGENPEKEIESDLSIRMEYINELTPFLKSTDVLLGTTGFTGRELYQNLDHPGKFYMAGSMGCLASLGLGVALENRDRRVFLLDGDGAVLMKMGSLATVGFYKPDNIIHICFDNGSYESTGNQPTVSSGTDLGKIAKSCGYEYSTDISNIGEFKKILDKLDRIKKPAFLRVIIKSGTPKGLLRPGDTPEEMKNKFGDFLR